MFKILSVAKISIIRGYRLYLIHTLFAATSIIVFLIPNIIVGDGTVTSYFRLATQYTFSLLSTILTISIIAFSAMIMCNDLEQYQMHLVVTKPINKIQIWTGKFLGVLTIHLIILIYGYMSFYLYISHLAKKPEYTKSEKLELTEKIFTGRSSLLCNRDEITKLFIKKYKDKVEQLTRLGKSPSKQYLEDIRQNTYRQALVQSGEIKPGSNRIFNFDKVPRTEAEKLTLKYKVYVGSIDVIARQNKPSIEGKWAIKDFKSGKFVEINNPQERIFSNVVNEIKIPNYTESNSIQIEFKNNSNKQSVFFQLNESPSLLVPQGEFMNNMSRALFVSFLYLIFLSALCCALSAIFSLPIAVFTIISYISIGSFTSFLSEGNQQTAYLKLLNTIVPIQKFDISNKISSGVFINNSLILNIILELMLMKEFPVILVALYLYSRKEIGLVEKK